MAKEPVQVNTATMKEAADLAKELSQPNTKREWAVPAKPRAFGQYDASEVPGLDLLRWLADQLPEDANEEQVLFGFVGVDFTVRHLKEARKQLD